MSAQYELRKIQSKIADFLNDDGSSIDDAVNLVQWIDRQIDSVLEEDE
jgi:hypothetical protein